MHSEEAMTDSGWDSAWLTPWEAVQLVVCLHSGGGSRMARLVPEQWIREDGTAVVFRTLHHRSFPLVCRRSKPREGLIPMRTGRMFRDALGKVRACVRAGHVLCKISIEGRADRRHKRNFKRNRL
jgi:hypothetical protein